MARSSSQKRTWISGCLRAQTFTSISASTGTTGGTASITSCSFPLTLMKKLQGRKAFRARRFRPLQKHARVRLFVVDLAALTGGAGKTLVHLLQVGLQAILNLLFERREFNSHPHTRVAGPDHAVRSDLVRINPEGNDYDCADGQRNQRLDVAAATAHVGRTSLHVRALSIWKTDRKWKLNFVAREPALLCSMV